MKICKDFFKKFKGFLVEPTKTFAKEKNTTLGDAFKYALILFFISSILAAVWSFTITPLFSVPEVYKTPGMELLYNPVFIFVWSYVGSIIFSLLGGLWIHLFAYLFGAKKGLKQTIKTVFYAQTPNVFGGLPIIGMVFGIWSLFLQFLGLKALHGMKGDKAALTVVVAILIPILVALVLGAAIVLTYLF
ncbi:MAG: YIP1 family protein [Nanoarchaeota archaeon]